MFNLVKMSKMDLGIVLLTLLEVFTRHGYLCVTQIPPVGKAFTVIQARKGIPSVSSTTLQFPIVIYWLKNLKGMSANSKVVGIRGVWVVDDVIPRACSILVGHPMVVITFCVMPCGGISTEEINRTLAMKSTSMVGTCWTPFAFIRAQLPANAELPAVRPTRTFTWNVARHVAPILRTVVISISRAIVEAVFASEHNCNQRRDENPN